jgi:hypothetical protein
MKFREQFPSALSTGLPETTSELHQSAIEGYYEIFDPYKGDSATANRLTDPAPKNVQLLQIDGPVPHETWKRDSYWKNY